MSERSGDCLPVRDETTDMKPPKGRPNLKRDWRASVASLLCLTLASCVGATPMPKRTRTPQGVEQKTIDLAFIQPGHTTRTEVAEKLKPIDTGYLSDRYFLGRWSSSSSGGWIFLIGMGGGVGNAERFWKSGNLLVEFDDQGVVRNSKTFPDKQLVEELAPVVAAHPAPGPDPQELAVTYLKGEYRQAVPAKIVLSASSFEFEELGAAKKRQKFTLPARGTLRVGTSFGEQLPDPVYSGHTLHFAENLKPLGGPKGKDIHLQMSSPALVQLLSFIAYASKQAEPAPSSP
jgi:hypothetical protein